MATRIKDPRKVNGSAVRVTAHKPVTAATQTEPASWYRRLVASAARDWRLSEASVAVILALPFLVVLTGVITALLGKEEFKWFLEEDRFAENLQVLGFGLAALFSGLIALRYRRTGDNRLSAAFLIMALGLIFVTAEEVSWGQRALDFETPEALEDFNRQGELNVHNLHLVEKTFWWAQFGVGAWGSVLPLLLLRYPGWLSRHRRELSRLVPHYTLLVYFGCTLLWRGYRNIVPHTSPHEFVLTKWSEVVELNLALGFLLFMLFQWRRVNAPLEGVE